MTLTAKDMRIGEVSIQSKDHPEWGSWGISREIVHDGTRWWDIIGDRGSRIIHEGELELWELSPQGNPYVSESELAKCRDEEDTGIFPAFRRINPTAGMTAKGRRMEEKIAEKGSAEAASAVVYSAAKRGVPGLVKREWAREHGYPKPNPVYTYNEAYAEILDAGFRPIPGSARYENDAGQLARIVPLSEYDDTFSIEVGAPPHEQRAYHGVVPTGNPSEIHFDGEEVVSPKSAVDYIESLGVKRDDAGSIAADMQDRENMVGDFPSHISILREINDLSGGYGVESFLDDNGILLVEYVEMGDLYTPTVIYDWNTNRFYLSTLGDWREKYEREL